MYNFFRIMIYWNFKLRFDEKYLNLIIAVLIYTPINIYWTWCVKIDVLNEYEMSTHRQLSS